ncbi:hypothetical protein RJ639_005134 [Escallonia herrerae]|uniref:CBF1-interacting co-repressor CIR N-terminal domain-containing protein n=1 Tax=Escallonia herrerae TaxID=1293975 RepID=A0AA89AZH4_9ASTE|nr:hypothetical protein RJ639_005134 [Escallonia herrerae]
MALKFLNKKGWHTGNLRNIENVWKAEKKHDAEQKNSGDQFRCSFTCQASQLHSSGPTGRNGLKRCKFDKIYQFGDSISDTGNLIREGTGGARTAFARPQTFFKNATGRCSNGMLMIDYIGSFKQLTMVNWLLRVIQDGVVHVVVPGNFPIGCLPIYLTTFQSNISAAYDDHHCVKDLNNFAMYHNELLQHAIHELN